MQRLLYISESRIAEADAKSVVSQIVERAQIKNARLGLTGALLFTDKYFVQVLEGSHEAIHTLMAYIHTDSRHGNITVVDKSTINDRLFPDWHMAYHGPSRFVSRRVERLLHATSQSEQRRASDWLTDLAWEFSKMRNLSSLPGSGSTASAA